MVFAPLFDFLFRLSAKYERRLHPSTSIGGPGRVRSLPFNLYVKSGNLGCAREADVIKFVRTHTTIPVPDVIFSANGKKRTYMIMKKIEGRTLEHTWPELDPAQKAKVIHQLHSLFEQLRTIASPHGVAVCALGNLPLKDARLSSATPFGPFNNEGEFNDHLIAVAERYMEDLMLYPIRARMRDDHRIVFTHGDLAPRNILVQGDEVVGLIDWEHSGWYPEHWDFVKALYAPLMYGTDWNSWVKDIFTENYECDWMLDREMTDNMHGAL